VYKKNILARTTDEIFPWAVQDAGLVITITRTTRLYNVFLFVFSKSMHIHLYICC